VTLYFKEKRFFEICLQIILKGNKKLFNPFTPGPRSAFSTIGSSIKMPSQQKKTVCL